MKNFFKKLLVLGAIVLSISSITVAVNPNTVSADSSSHKYGSCVYFLGMVSWDCNLPTINSQDNLKSGVWIIAANILTDIGVIASYLVVGYVIYGGYLYILSSGDPNKVASGKKTLTHAFTGLAIVLLASVIINAIRMALLNGSGAFSDDCIHTKSCVEGSTLVTNLLNWVIGISGIVSVAFVLIGGIGYMTSSGDSNKLQKAKNTIMYALIGLAIVGLAEIIVIFVSNIINDANTTGTINQTLIAKEYHEN